MKKKSVASHTPGPWSLGTGATREIWGYQDDENQNDVMIAKCPDSMLPLDQRRSNARLIATAPELLEAVRRWADDIHTSGEGDICDDKKLCAACRVIAKAEGR